MPRDCKENCDDDFRERVGCGYTHYGKSCNVYRRDGPHRAVKDAEDYELTCPQFFKQTVFYQSVMEDLEDYRNNRLGHSWDLPAPLLTYLKVADNESKTWASYWEAELMNGK